MKEMSKKRQCKTSEPGAGRFSIAFKDQRERM